MTGPNANYVDVSAHQSSIYNAEKHEYKSHTHIISSAGLF